MPESVHVFTSAALNYIPKVRVLFNSLRRYHPSWHLHLVLADKLPANVDFSSEPFDTITTIEELGIDHWDSWVFGHTLTELATAIKPWMLERLLIKSGDSGKVIYLDPDTVVFSPLDDIVSALDNTDIVLTPHQTSPENNLEAVIDNEICSLKHGIYNLGFIAVSNRQTGRAFSRWWAERTYYFCRDDIKSGLFTDQRWIDLVPALFPSVHILRSSRHNVATWNINTRKLTVDANGCYFVDGKPLGFYHFTGFDSGAHLIMASKYGQNSPSLQSLIEWYASQVTPVANDPLSQYRWAFESFDSGSPITHEQRLVYRARRDLQRRYPNPFSINGYDSWWTKYARSEYPRLFSASTKLTEISRLNSILVPGLAALDQTANKKSSITRRAIIEAIRSPSMRVKFFNHAMRILRSEGIKGIVRRLFV